MGVSPKSRVAQLCPSKDGIAATSRPHALVERSPMNSVVSGEFSIAPIGGSLNVDNEIIPIGR
jgi:hypothetical protein